MRSPIRALVQESPQCLCTQQGCGDGGSDEDEDASIVDASSDFSAPDVRQNIDARRPDTICSSDPPTIGTPCLGILYCNYDPYEDCHWDCFVYDCPSGCSPSRRDARLPCESSRYRCKDGTWNWASNGSSAKDPCPPFYCICPDAGPDGSSRVKVDSAVDHDDAGSDDDAGN